MGTQDVPGEYYDPNTVYSGSYSSNAVYQSDKTLLTNNVDNISCSGKSTLIAEGTVKMNIKYSNLSCSGGSKTLYMGNYLNYDSQGGASTRTRIAVAKEVITQLINETNNVRFGLMKFNPNNSTDPNSTISGDSGGKLVKQIGATKAELVTAIEGLTASGWTPLAETLAEAGLYFAGKTSWFNSSTTYSSPIQYRCQKNYIILMTDGEPTHDDHSKLVSGLYINGDKIGDYDKDGKDPGTFDSRGTDYLDDVAKYLYVNDIRPDLGTSGESFERQNITTYTIGFTTAQQLLQDTATNGGGLYYTAYSASGLKNAFKDIISAIADVNAVFVSPVVPVSKMNRTYAGDRLYLGFFKPQEGRWLGNIKKYGLDPYGEIIDSSGALATFADGAIRDNARSYWSSSADGAKVSKGGVGGVLLEQDTRNLYTYTGTQASLTDVSNAFSTTNTAIKNTEAEAVINNELFLNVTSSTERNALFKDILGTDRNWILGDILHSQPLVVQYPSDTYIFAGSDDGMMHAFKDSTGIEQWGFIPPDQLERLKMLSAPTVANPPIVFVDGSPALYEDSSQKILFFGERRGGDNYFALDVTNPDSPIFRYRIRSNHLGGSVPLGQSWSTPKIAKIKISSGHDNVFLMAGGYDTNQDADIPAASDTKGKAVFTLNASDGTVSRLNVNAANHSDMTHCIVDVSGFDSIGEGYVNRVYAGDLGGKVFAFEDDNGDGNWSHRTLFSAPTSGGNQKIFYAPDAVKENYGDMIFFGTGDREHPEDSIFGPTVVNRIYAIKNEWKNPAPPTLTESDLTDVTDNLIALGTASQREAAEVALDASKGWFLRLENPGEKMTSSVTVFGGVLYFTTYTPESSAGPSSDPCNVASGRGQSRFYALKYRTGAAAYNYSSDVETNADGEVVEKGKKDRSKIIGTSIASSPFVAILPGGIAKIYIGTEGGVKTEDPVATTDMNMYYWRQILQ
jgi:type IV pilus assembly protein PilY1